jgi:hypothetical protein
MNSKIIATLFAIGNAKRLPIVLLAIAALALPTVITATAEPARAGCAYSKTTWSWWGTYTYLNRCAALETADAMLAQGGAAYSNGVKLGPHVAALGGAVAFNRFVVAQSLRACANRHGQAYLKYPYSFVGLAAEVSCR